MGKVFSIIIALLIAGMNGSCQASMIDIKANSEVIIDRVIDMEGTKVILPEQVTLYFKKGGCLKNGELVGNKAKIVGHKHAIFDNVTISGVWDIRYISTDMFCDLTEVNSLKNVVALASPDVENVLTIMPGHYKVAAKSVTDRRVLPIPSNTEVIMNGVVTMEPNWLAEYDVFTIEGDNVFFHGNGTVRGDKFTHIGEKYEWGMGISVLNSNNVRIYDVRVEQCWGDCIFIDGNSQNVHICNCILDHGRRQGISVISGNDIVIENCLITNVGGTPPQCAIDVEPDENKTVGSVIIRNITVTGCVGGIMSWGSAPGAIIKSIELYDCYVKGTDESRRGVPYSFNGTDDLLVEDCHSDIEKKPNLSKMGKVRIR